MSDLFSQLGINLPMLAAQAVNFGVLLIVLSAFVYRPLIKAMKERREKIELGIKGAELAEQKLSEAGRLGEEKVKAAGEQALKIVGAAEDRARERGAEIVAAAQSKSEEIVADGRITAEKKKQEEMAKLSAEAARLIKAAIVKTVELSPDEVDDKLIARAVGLVGNDQ
jgi:F-type H+-transporting ATPase subunit b